MALGNFQSKVKQRGTTAIILTGEATGDKMEFHFLNHKIRVPLKWFLFHYNPIKLVNTTCTLPN
jgi:hypothetical protein